MVVTEAVPVVVMMAAAVAAADTAAALAAIAKTAGGGDGNGEGGGCNSCIFNTLCSTSVNSFPEGRRITTTTVVSSMYVLWLPCGTVLHLQKKRDTISRAARRHRFLNDPSAPLGCGSCSAR